MSIFCSATAWVIAFEVLAYTITNGAFENYLYAYGSCLPKEGLLFADVVLSELPEFPLIDPQTQAWIADWSDWYSVVKEQKFHFNPSRNDYLHHNISVEEEDGPGSLPESAVLRYFVAAKGSELLFMSSEELIASLRGCAGMELLLQTCEWEHPDVAGGASPSSSSSIRSALAAIQDCRADLFSPGIVNTHWEAWQDKA